MPDSDGCNGQPQPDAEAHVEVEIIGEDRIHGAHAGVPAVQDPMAVEHRIGHQGDDQSHQTADNRPERQHHADEDQAQVQLDPRGHRRQEIFGMPGQLDPGNGDQADGLGEQQIGNRGQQDVNGAKHETDHAADGEKPPFPALLLVFRGLRQGHGAQSPHRRHGKRQLFHIGSDAVKGIAQAELIDTLDDLGADQKQNRDEPVAVKKSAFDQ